MSQIGFYILAALSVFSGLMVVFSKKAMHSVLYLIFCFFTIAGHYIMLNAQFLAAVHLIVYAGAIMVLFLFVIMFMNLNKQTDPHKSTFLKFAAVISGGLMTLIMAGTFGIAQDVKGFGDTDPSTGLVETLGNVLYNQYMLPFEISALLFLVAMVGATMIGKKETH